jgi:hypothetical protein
MIVCWKVWSEPKSVQMGVGKDPILQILKFLQNAGPTTMNCGASKTEDCEFIPFKKAHYI